MDTLDFLILFTVKTILLLLTWVVFPIFLAFLPVIFWRGWVWAYNSFGQHVKYRKWVRLFFLWKEHNQHVILMTREGRSYLIDAVDHLDGRYGQKFKNTPDFLANELVHHFELPVNREAALEAGDVWSSG